MKMVAEIVTAIVLLASGAFFAPKAIESFKIETLHNVDQGLLPLSDFSEKLSKP